MQQGMQQVMPQPPMQPSMQQPPMQQNMQQDMQQGMQQSMQQGMQWQGQQAMPGMQGMNNVMGLPVSQVPPQNSRNTVANAQGIPQVANVQGQQFAVIALPAGAPPPRGAIPMGAMDSVNSYQEPPPPSRPSQNQSNVQIIALPVGVAPPEGAIPVDHYPVPPQTPAPPGPPPPGPAPSPETDREPLLQPAKSNRLQIINPRTGEEVQAPLERSSSRRMRIVNPKTGEEVR
mmetsp:Transcript_51399/g.91491  ORF Transcript_51399/g.91491 Transcript_51399/m.91491 type:complete len:231 (+) Transcript_51399:3-695(+)